MKNASVVHRLVIPVTFPSGVAPGAGKQSGNLLVLAMDGLGRHVLRGTALSGALRHAWAESRGKLDRSPLEPHVEVQRRFGNACDGDRGTDAPSPLRVEDVVLDTGGRSPGLRHHNAIDRHTGAVRNGGLFLIESLPPGTRGTLRLSLHSDDEWARSFLAELLGILAQGLTLGGSAARGIGMVKLGGDASIVRYELDSSEGLSRWLDDSWQARSKSPSAVGAPGPSESLKPVLPAVVLRVEALLAVPPGQDLCVGDGQGLDHTIEPQRVLCADGKLRFRLPGSSLRGVFRGWITRLAAREGIVVADSHERFKQCGPAQGDAFGWGLEDDESRKRIQERLEEDASSLEREVPCPVMRLFGSLYAKGRLHIEDALSEAPCDDRQVQSRMHVAVDRITGGANDGFLFDHQALLAGARFRVVMVVRDPSQNEARWIASSLRALDLGVLRVGTSKSSGRLALGSRVEASGPHAGEFTTVIPRAQVMS